jgi:hypothetical protein
MLIILNPKLLTLRPGNCLVRCEALNQKSVHVIICCLVKDVSHEAVACRYGALVD